MGISIHIGLIYAESLALLFTLLLVDSTVHSKLSPASLVRNLSQIHLDIFQCGADDFYRTCIACAKVSRGYAD